MVFSFLLSSSFQFTMLSGKVPFQSSNRDRSAESIMSKIKGGEFSMKGSDWETVSDDAKTLIRGLLTVDPSKRVTMSHLLDCDWLKANKSEVSHHIAPVSLRSGSSCFLFV